jgi:hypothetical protein
MLKYKETPSSDEAKADLRNIVITSIGVEIPKISSFPGEKLYIPLSKLNIDTQDDSLSLVIDLSYTAKISGLHEGCYYCLSLSISIGDTVGDCFLDLNNDNAVNEVDLYDFFYRLIIENEHTVHAKYPAVQLCATPGLSNQFRAKYLLRADIPVDTSFYHLKNMIEEGKNQLLDCYRLFLTLKSEGSRSHHFLEASGRLNENQASEILQWNFKYPFLRFFYEDTSKNTSRVNISYYSFNQHDSYDKLLKKWKAVAKNEIKEIEEQVRNSLKKWQ